MAGPALIGWVWANIATLPTDAPKDARSREVLGTLSRRRFSIRCQYTDGLGMRRSGPGGGVPDVTCSLVFRVADLQANSWTPAIGDLLESVVDRQGAVLESRNLYLVGAGASAMGIARRVMSAYSFHTDMPARRDD